MNDLIFSILKIVIVVAVVLITRFLVPYIKSRLSVSEYQTVISLINAAVLAAEQTIKGKGQGAVKKEQVMEQVTKWLNEHKIKISYEQLDALVESAVYEMNRSKL